MQKGTVHDSTTTQRYSPLTNHIQALRKTHVNIFDYVDAKRAGRVIPTFRSHKQLTEYTETMGKTFPKAAAKEANLSILLEVLF